VSSRDDRVEGSDAIADLKDVAAVLRAQASRIAELESEVTRARSAADSARAYGAREGTRRVEVQTELHAMRRTRVWRYSALPRRVYGWLLLRLRRGREAEPPA
jgi:hypothetical protein